MGLRPALVWVGPLALGRHVLAQGFERVFEEFTCDLRVEVRTVSSLVRHRAGLEGLSFPPIRKKRVWMGHPGFVTAPLGGFVVSAVRKIADGFRELARTVYGLIERVGGTVRVLG